MALQDTIALRALEKEELLRQALAKLGAGASKGVSTLAAPLAVAGAGKMGWDVGRTLGETPLITDPSTTYDQEWQNFMVNLMSRPQKAVTLEQQKPVVTNFPLEQQGVSTTTMPALDTSIPQERFLPSDLKPETPGFMPVDEELLKLLQSRQGMYVGETDPSKPGTFSNLADRKMRREISDKEAKLIDPNLEKATNWAGLKDVLSHPELYKKYPELADMPVKSEWNMKDSRGTYSKKDPEAYGNEAIRFAELLSNSQVEDTLLHEIQHAIQEKEGWARGGSPEQFGQERGQALARVNFLNSELSVIAKKLDESLPEEQKVELQKQYDAAMSEKMRLAPSIVNTPVERYQRLAGEIEARDTASRKNLTMEERLAKQPYASQGIPLKDWIVKTDSGKAMSTAKGGEIMYHGTSAKEDFVSFKGDVVYLAGNEQEANAFAQNPILGGGRGKGSPRVLKIEAPAGKTKDINAIVEDTIMNDGDLDAIVSEQAKIARKEGYDYLTFNHPSSVEGVDEFKATIAINPSKLKLSPNKGIEKKISGRKMK